MMSEEIVNNGTTSDSNHHYHHRPPKTISTNTPNEDEINNNEEEPSSYEYVDYTPPKSAKILPPAKYKLFLLILILVYFAVWVTELAGFYEFLRFNGWFSPEFAQFVMLGLIVFVLTFATLDLFVACLTFPKSDGKGAIGIGPWLKAPRIAMRLNLYNEQHNFLLECLIGIVQILEEGFEMFDAPPPPPGGGPSSGHIDSNKRFTCPNGKCQTVLKIEHRVNPDKIEEYKVWLERIGNAAKISAPGLLKTQRSFITLDTSTTTRHEDIMDDDDASDIETGIEHSEKQNTKNKERRGGVHFTMKTSNPSGDAADAVEEGVDNIDSVSVQSGQGVLHCVYLTFKDVHSLNEWMMSPRRKVIMEDLEPLLIEPDVVQIQIKRELPDAFTDLLIRQGESVPTLAPKKWKVSWLTTIALFLSIKWVNHFMDYYYEFWNIDTAHPRIQSLVANVVTVFVNSYILVPLLLFVFNHWLKREKQVEPKSQKEPWKTLNDGFQSIWSKALLTFALYGGCVITWIVKTYS